MAAKEIAVKKYIVKLSEAERNHLQAAISKGKSPAKRLLKARILLKDDASEHLSVHKLRNTNRHKFRLFFVIASEAKQSRASH